MVRVRTAGRLTRTVGMRWSVVLQAMSFGLLHLSGFPPGSVGALLAGVYGVLLDVI